VCQRHRHGGHPRVEGGIGVACRFEPSRRLMQQRQLFCRPTLLQRTFSRQHRHWRGRTRLARREQMARHGVGWCATLLQAEGHAGMQRRQQRLGQVAAHGFQHRVVCEGRSRRRAAENLRALQLGPGVGHVQRRNGHHVSGHRDAEFGASHGGHACQPLRAFTQPLQALGEYGVHAGR